jgi:hypothetical protein
VDWEDAAVFFVSLPPGERSYRRVAEHYGVSVRTVERHGREGRWQQRAREVDAQAARRADQEIAGRRSKQLVEFQRLIDASCVVYARGLASGEVRITASEFVALIKAALLLQGDAATRVELVTGTQGWESLRGRILAALEAFPEARLAIAAALEETDEDD